MALVLFLVLIGSAAARAATMRAVSLRALQDRIRACRDLSRCPLAVTRLAHLKGITAVVLDRANRDVILVGRAQGPGPALHTADLIVALQNAFMVHARRRGRTIYYSYPGCSIDPSPQVMRRLSMISARRGEIGRHLDAWRAVCRFPQRVRVMGVPRRSRFAWVMVKADYDMKRLVSGGDRLDIPGFSDLTRMMMARVRQNSATGRPTRLSMMNRFWFFPGRIRFLEDRGVVALASCRVALLTEAQSLARRGRITGLGRPNPMAAQFARQFTAHYAEISRRRPIYKELANLYRMVALAKIIKAKNWDKRAGLDLAYLLGRRVPRVAVPQTVPGHAHVGYWSQRRKRPGGYAVYRLWLPSCGGVSMRIKPGPRNIARDRSGTTRGLRARVLSARKAAVGGSVSGSGGGGGGSGGGGGGAGGPLFWDVRLPIHSGRGDTPHGHPSHSNCPPGDPDCDQPDDDCPADDPKCRKRGRRGH